MGTEGEQEIVEGKVAVTEPEAVVEVALPDVASLEAELEKTRQELENARREAKAHQRNVSKKDTEVQAQRKIQESLGMRMDLLTDMIAEVMDKSESPDYEDKPQQRKSDVYKQRMAEAKKSEVDAVTKTQEALIKTHANEIIQLTSPKGLELDKSPELLKAYNKWLTGDYEGAVEEVKSVMDKTTEVKEVVNQMSEEQFEKMYQERRKKERIESGELDAETGKPKAGSMGDTDFLTQFADGSLPMTKENIDRANKINSS